MTAATDSEPTQADIDALLELTVNPADRLWRYPICNAVIGVLARTPITPNQVTIFHTVLGVAAGFVISMGTTRAFVVAGVMFEARAVLDCMDGVLARVTKRSSPFGRALDQLGDTIGFLSLMGGALACLGPLWGWPKALVVVLLTMPISGSCSAAWDLYRRRFTSLMKDGYDSTEQEYLTLCQRLDEQPRVSLHVSKIIALWGWYTLSPHTVPRLRERVARRDWPREGEVIPVTATGRRIQAAALRNDPELRAMLGRLAIVAGDNIILILTVSLLLGQYLSVFPLVMVWGVSIWAYTAFTVSRYLNAEARGDVPTV